MTETLTKYSLIYQRLKVTPEQLINFCENWLIAELLLFGSVLRDDFSDSSDIDILVSYLPSAKRGLLEKITLKEELENLFHRPVDLISKNAIESSNNWLRKKHILNSAEVIYVAR